MTTDQSHPLLAVAPRYQGRLDTRVAAVFPVELVMARPQRGSMMARSVDVGMGGICVRTESIIDGNAVEAVRFKLGLYDLEFKVHARWSSATLSDEGPLTGFAFEEVDPKSEATLWGFIQERARELSTFLRTCDGLTDLGFQDALELALTTRLRELECGQVVYGGHETTGCKSIFALFRGSILLERASEKRNQEIARLEPGELFGGTQIIAGCEPIERAIATSRTTLLEFVDYNTEYLMIAKPQLGASLIRAAAFHWMQRTARLLDHTFAVSDPR